jgi:putative transposase
MASRSTPKKLPVRGKVPGTLDRHDDENWKRFERVAQALRSLGDSPMTRSQAERLARRFGVHCSTIYRYRIRLDDIGTATSIAGHKRGWKSFASRLSAKQEEVVEQAIKLIRKKAGPLRVVDLVEEVSALCRLQQIACPSRPAINSSSVCSATTCASRRQTERHCTS